MNDTSEQRSDDLDGDKDTVSRTSTEDGESVEVLGNADDVHRILVMAHEGLGGDRLNLALEQAAREGRASQFHIVVPISASGVSRLTSDTGVETEQAGTDVEGLLAEIRKTHPMVTGSIGDSDPRLALEDILRSFPADEIVVANPTMSEMSRQQRSATARALEDVDLPVTVLHI